MQTRLARTARPSRVGAGNRHSLQPAVEPRRSSDLRRNLYTSTGDAVSFSLMVGLGETYIPAFVLALGYGDVAAGLVTTVPLAAGAVLQLISPAGVQRVGSHRRWVVLCAALQAACFLPLCLGAALGQMALAAIFTAATVYWGAGLATGGAWNTWIETIVPGRVRAHYFALRTRLAQLALLIGFVVGGVALHIAAQHGVALQAFAALFSVAALCRLVSALLLNVQSEPVALGDDHRHVGVVQWLRRARHGADGRLLTYLFAVQISAQMAGPYFTPYMLKTLKFSYADYVILIAVAFAAKAVTLPLFGRVAHDRGAFRLLCWSGVAIVPMSTLWTLSTDYRVLIFVQIAAGSSWAAFELASFLLFFEAIPRQERTSVLTTFNLGNSLATAIGSLIGGTILYLGDRSMTAYWTMFILSSIGRALSLLALARARDQRPGTERRHAHAGHQRRRQHLGRADSAELARLRRAARQEERGAACASSYL